jgi:hypothetical protein
MRLNEQYIMFYGIAIFLTALMLMAAGVEGIEIYYAVYLIEFLVTIQLLGPFRRSLESNLRPVIVMFLLGFFYVLAQRMIQILS